MKIINVHIKKKKKKKFFINDDFWLIQFNKIIIF